MMQEFYDFDKQLIHKKYQAITQNALAMVSQGDQTKWKCAVCDYFCDPSKGDPEHGVELGTVATAFLVVLKKNAKRGQSHSAS
jgi:hypothetical protein